jgi:hypothetical protein
MARRILHNRDVNSTESGELGSREKERKYIYVLFGIVMLNVQNSVAGRRISCASYV